MHTVMYRLLVVVEQGEGRIGYCDFSWFAVCNRTE